jgi:hypothetical protein
LLQDQPRICHQDTMPCGFSNIVPYILTIDHCGMVIALEHLASHADLPLDGDCPRDRWFAAMAGGVPPLNSW